MTASDLKLYHSAASHRLARFPDRLMAVHARAVVAVDRLRQRRFLLQLGNLFGWTSGPANQLY